MIRLLLADGDPAPVPLLDIGDDDYAVLLDVLDGDSSVERRPDGEHTGWVIDDETVEFLRFTGLTERVADVLRGALATREVLEVTWEEIA